MATTDPTINIHAANDDLAIEIGRIASERGLTVRHNVTNSRRGAHDGYHRYLVLDPSIATADYSIRSRACVSWSEARFSRNYLPSISGEREALAQLRDDLVSN